MFTSNDASSFSPSSSYTKVILQALLYLYSVGTGALGSCSQRTRVPKPETPNQNKLTDKISVASHDQKPAHIRHIPYLGPN